MAIIAKAAVKAYFETDDKPTEAQFIDLVDSYLDFDPTILAIATAAQAGQAGLLVIEATGQATVKALGAGVIAFLGATTTAAARNALELGTLATADSIGIGEVENSTSGSLLVFNAAGSAVSLSGTSERLFLSQGSALATFTTFASVATTADASVAGCIILATTADVVSANRQDRVPAVNTMRVHTGVNKGWLKWNTSSAAIEDSYNISSIANIGVARTRVVFTVPFDSSAYAICGAARQALVTNPRLVCIMATVNGNQSAAGCKVQVHEAGAGVTDTADAYCTFIGDFVS